MKILRLCLFTFFAMNYVNSYSDSTTLGMDIKIISAKELHDHYLNNEKYILIDNRPESKYRMGHIPKAINLTYFRDGSPDNVLNKEKLLKVAKNKIVIFYCTGHSRAYYAALDSLQKWKFPKNRIIWFKGGMIEWFNVKYPVSKI